MSGMREDIARLKQLLPDPQGQAVGLVPTLYTFTDSRGITQYGYQLTAVAPGSAQTKIQFQDEGVNLGTSGTVDTVNWVGTGVTATRVGNTITVTIPTPTVPTGANPTASVGLTAVNGVATTFLRSDGAPALSQAITPTWTGLHQFANGVTVTAGDLKINVGDVYGGSAGHVRSIGAATTYGITPTIYIGLTGDSDPPNYGRLFTDNGGGKIDALRCELGTSNASIQKGLYLDGVISPSALASGSTANWNPTGLATASMIRVTPDSGGSTLTGIVAPTFGAQAIYLLNLGSGTLTLSNQSIGSTAANRLILGTTSVVLNSGQGIRLWYDATTSRWRVTSATSSGSTSQGQIQIQDEGSNQGTAGQATTYNFTGGGVTASVASATATINIPSGIAAAGVMYFGTGIDGDVTLDGTNTYSFLTKSGSIYTATRDLYLDNLSFGGAGQLNMVGFRLFVYGTWDPSGTSAQPSVYWPANNGANASAASLGAGGAVSSVAGQLANGCAGSNGVNGAATGTPGNPTAGASTGGSQRNNGGRGGPPSTIVASGGTGSSGSGGNSILSGVPIPFVFQLPYPNVTYMSSLGAISAIGGGGGGTGGGGASGNGVNPGGGGGGGGAGGNMVYIAARTIAVTNGLSGVAAVTGGSGGNGGTPVSGTNCGSGGGGSGGGGGLIHVVFQSLSGSGSMTVTANGGPGGNAGTPTGTGTSGKGGTGGDGGLVVLFNVGAGTATSSTATSGSAGSGATGGSGGTSAGTLTP